jgi:hypothetical protein
MKTPEEMAIEWLREEYGDTSNWTYMGQEMSLDAFHAGYQAAKDQFADSSKVMPQWVSVKDRLPEEDIAVLVYGQVLNDPPDVIGVRRRYNGDQEWKHTWESEDGFIYREDDVTHWMPLPKPPEGK